MSRLLIKNLPAYTTPAQLQAHFTQPGGPGGVLTDAKVARRNDGTARRFGFVGYKTDAEAHRAAEWFDRTYIDASRITVCVVKGAKDAPAPRPNKRLKLDDDGRDDKPSQPPPPPKKSTHDLDEFIKVMQPRAKKGPLWANDAVPEEPSIAQDDDADAHDEAISDLEWMKRRMGGGAVDERAFEQSDDDDDDDSGDKHDEPQQPQDPTIDTIRTTSRLFVRNLAFSCTEQELVGLFSPFGDLVQVHIPIDITTKHSKGMAYITFKSPSSAVAAYEALDRTSFQGRLIHILAAVDRRGVKSSLGEAGGRKRSVKEDKQVKRKQAAGKEFNWGLLYMNADAVASSIADRLNIDKAAILNPNHEEEEEEDEQQRGANAAVRLALAETHIINETKTFLESHGVDLSSLSHSSSSHARSDTVILVKNIPYGTSETDIRALFEPHGALARVLVPPAGTMAVVQYERAEEARVGFRAVAYRRLGNSVVYLEKGPQGMFVEGAVGPGPSTYALHGKRIAEQELGAGAGEDADADGEEGSITGGATLYVKNLAFSTTQERLVGALRHLPSFTFARVQTKPDPKRPGVRVSMGYGFVGFRDRESARRALGSLRGFVLDGHELFVKFAGRGVERDEKGVGVGEEMGKGKGKRTTKMVVKNVPFEATKKDIQALFGTHGHLKSVRLPRKFDSRTRGFAFLDFVSRAEAEHAYAALRYTHLLGRHLVLEWAAEEEEKGKGVLERDVVVEALRRKAGVGFGDGRGVPGRKRKIDMGREEEGEDVEGLEG